MSSNSETKVFQIASTYGSNIPYENLSVLDNSCNIVDKMYCNVLISIWKYFFTFGYYIGVIPFKPVYNHETDRWQLKTWKLQQIFCFLVMWALCCFEVIADVLDRLISGFNSQQKLTAKSYFVAINNLVYIIYTVLFLLNITKYSKQIEQQLNDINSLTMIVPRKTAKWCYVYVMFSLVIFGCCSVLPLPFTTMEGEYLASFQESFEYQVDRIRERFLMSPTSDRFSTENIFLGVLHYCLRYSMVITTFMYEGIISCLLPVTFWLIVKVLNEDVRALTDTSNNLMLMTKQSYLVKIKNRYEEIKKVSNSVNQVWSTMALVWLTDTAIRSMMMLNQLVSSRKIFSVLTIGFWALSIVVFLIFSGETFRMMDCFEEVLLEEQNWDQFYNQDKTILIRLLNELKGKPIGIGATGLYKINYGFIAQLLVAILTLFLVSFENDDK